VREGESEENPVELEGCNPADVRTECSGEHWNPGVPVSRLEQGLPRKPRCGSGTCKMGTPFMGG
jgi:hypothetical protein